MEVLPKNQEIGTRKLSPSCQVVGPGPSLLHSFFVCKLGIFVDPFMTFSQLLLRKFWVLVVFEGFINISTWIVKSARDAGIAGLQERMLHYENVGPNNTK
jgi:hypothetical protein